MSPLDAERQRLAEQYIPLAKSVADRIWHRQGKDARHDWLFDELRAAACLGLVQCASTYRQEGEVGFAAYARHRIRWTVMECLWEVRGFQRVMVNHEHRWRRLSVTDWSKIDLARFGVSRECTAIDDDGRDDLTRSLTAKQANVCRLIYWDDMRQEEVAKIVGLSKARVSRIHDEAIKTLGR